MERHQQQLRDFYRGLQQASWIEVKNLENLQERFRTGYCFEDKNGSYFKAGSIRAKWSIRYLYSTP
jgi:hypothetical protein